MNLPFWRRRQDEALDEELESHLRKVVRISNQPATVIGVAPPEFPGLEVGLPDEVLLPNLVSRAGTVRLRPR